MFEVSDSIDGIISIAGGTFAYLAATGKVKINKSEEKSEEWRNKYGKLLKVLGPFLVLFGIFTISKPFLGL